jgi:hypothetical protein
MSAPEELPAPSAEIVLIRVFVQSYLATVSKRRGEAFLRHAADLLATEESLSGVTPIRPPKSQPAVTRARMQALALFRQYLPTLIASVGTE